MNIYVGNLPRQASETDLRVLFTQFGEVKSIKIIKDHLSGEAKGFAFVEMPDTNAANEAIRALDFKEYENKRLKVNEAKPKNTASKSFNSFSSPYGYKNRFEKY
jgi:cold-inducible RNA-binding protein